MSVLRSVVPLGQTWGQSGRLCSQTELQIDREPPRLQGEDGRINLLLADGMIIDVWTDF